MSTAILVRGAKGVVLDNVYIHGFARGIALEDASAILQGVKVSGCGMGLEAKHSRVVSVSSVFVDNIVDILIENASAELIDTIARKVISYLSSVTIAHYTVNPYQLVALSREILVEKTSKRRRAS